MGISSRFKVENPDSIVMTLTMSMTVKEWTELRDQLSQNGSAAWPAWQVQAHITDLIAQARKIYWPSADADKEPKP